jgi:tRNA nucleotidyltransferase (CCA-adding enzyme)
MFRMAALFHDIAKPNTREWSDKNNDWTFIDHQKVGEKLSQEILNRMKFSNDEIKYISNLVRYHLILYSKRWSGAAVRRWVRKIGPENLDDIIELATADSQSKGKAKKSWMCADADLLQDLKNRAHKALEAKPALDTKSLVINGNDIMSELGLKPGPEVGSLLNQLMEHVLDYPEDNNRETLLAIVKNIKND